MSYRQKLIDYSVAVTTGEVVACTKHRQACDRFLREINDPDFPYEFDEDRAENFAEWCKLFKHTKGILAGKTIELAPIQHFIFGNIYGWYSKDTGRRRFTKMYWQVARKNAKSQSNSLMSSYELFVFPKNEVAEVYSAATKREQSKIVYDETVAILNACEFLKKGEHYTTTNSRITRLSNGGFMRALSKEDRKSGDGLNPQFATIDEYHAHETSEVYDIIDSGMVARSEPLVSIITTAGFELNNPCYRVEYDLVSKILDPDNPTDLPYYFVMVNELESNTSDEDVEVNGRTVKPGELIDDINDPAVWAKANPIVCSYPEGVDMIKKRLEIATEAPEKMRDLMTKTFNVWVNERAFGYMNMAKWGACAEDREKHLVDISERTGGRCWVGIDLSAKLDLTSVSFEFRGDDDKFYVYNHSFIPREMFHAKLRDDRVPYDMWERDGWLTVTDGATVDYRAVRDYVLITAESYGWYIEEVCVDPWGATQISADLYEEGVTVVDIVQGYKTLSEPTKNLREMVYDGRLQHDGNPVLTWAMGNAVTRQDYNKNMTLDKLKAKQRIDPAASLVNAHVRAMVCGESASIYEKRGMRSL